MSNLIGKYDIGGVLDRFRARYGEQCLKSDRFQGHLEDFMDPDDPDRKLTIMFSGQLENCGLKRRESEAFNRELILYILLYLLILLLLKFLIKFLLLLQF